jgi:glucokinase
MAHAVGPRRLIGDIGATNARFALLDPAGGISRTRVLACDDFPTIEAAIGDYLAAEAGPAPQEAALAVASPITGDAVTLTNHPWSFSIAGLRERLALTRLLVVNDFAANALAVSRLTAEERSAIGGGTAIAGQPIGVIGPGTGLGVSGLVPTPSGWIAISGEGGHATMPPADHRESEVLEHMRRRFDHVSAERVLSGPGLVNLYNTLAEIESVPAAPFTPAQIADRQIGESDPLAREALELFCAMLGTVAGDLALTLGARGGVYIAGGIVPRLGPSFAASRFRERFEAKGRFRAYLAAIPTYVVTHPIPALLGLAALLDGSAPENASTGEAR